MSFDKINTHKDGHTRRFKQKERPWTMSVSNNHLLLVDRPYNKNHISTSEIDDFFPLNHVTLINEAKPLNTPEQWNNIEKELEEKAINVTKKWDPHYGVIKKTFDVPVTKYLIKENLEQYELNWLKWNDLYYDPKYIYSYYGDDKDLKGTLTKYCLREWEEPKINNFESIYKKTFNEVKPHKKTLQTKDSYWEIDLGSLQNISHIVTYGKYSITRQFPRNSSYKGNSFIKVLLNNRDESYVKKYSVSFKNESTQKWISYKTFDGNINPFTPKVNNVNILTRCIRIKPLDFVKSKSMIISIYSEVKPVKKNNVDVEEDEEIIKYTLVPPNNTEQRNDGYGERCISPEYVFRQQQKKEKRKRMKEHVQDQINGLHSDSDDCSYGENDYYNEHAYYDENGNYCCDLNYYSDENDYYSDDYDDYDDYYSDSNDCSHDENNEL